MQGETCRSGQGKRGGEAAGGEPAAENKSDPFFFLLTRQENSPCRAKSVGGAGESVARMSAGRGQENKSVPFFSCKAKPAG